MIKSKNQISAKEHKKNKSLLSAVSPALAAD